MHFHITDKDVDVEKFMFLVCFDLSTSFGGNVPGFQTGCLYFLLCMVLTCVSLERERQVCSSMEITPLTFEVPQKRMLDRSSSKRYNC